MELTGNCSKHISQPKNNCILCKLDNAEMALESGDLENIKIVISPLIKDIRAAASLLGRLGGLKGGVARAKKLSAERRKEIAKAAAEKRWSKK